MNNNEKDLELLNKIARGGDRTPEDTRAADKIKDGFNESGLAINWKKLKAEELLRKGYSKEDVGLLEFLKEDCLNKDVLKMYLERYIHNKAMYENENKKLKEKVQIKCKAMDEWVDKWRDFDSVSWYEEGIEELSDIIGSLQR